MSSKSKKSEEESIPLLGRFTTQLKIGIVGLPNVGSLQNAVPAFLNVVDIAGLVAGASEGQGLGNAFLSHIKECDAIFHMIRAFDDVSITHVNDEIDPIRDIKIIRDELRLKDIEYVKSRLEHMDRTIVRGNDPTKLYQVACMKKVLELLENNTWVRSNPDWNAKEVEVLNQHLLLTAKPMIYLINISEHDYIKKKNKWLKKINEWVNENDSGSLIIPLSVEFEEKLSKMIDPESYLLNSNAHSALTRIITSGFQTLKLHYFFTAGKDEVKAWTIQKGTKAPQAAGKIHTDFERGFIAAEVMKYDDFKEHGSENAVKAAGKYRQEGKTYVVQDGDIIFFKFNVTQQPKKK